MCEDIGGMKPAPVAVEEGREGGREYEKGACSRRTGTTTRAVGRKKNNCRTITVAAVLFPVIVATLCPVVPGDSRLLPCWSQLQTPVLGYKPLAIPMG